MVEDCILFLLFLQMNRWIVVMNMKDLIYFNLGGGIEMNIDSKMIMCDLSYED